MLAQTRKIQHHQVTLERVKDIFIVWVNQWGGKKKTDALCKVMLWWSQKFPLCKRKSRQGKVRCVHYQMRKVILFFTSQWEIGTSFSPTHPLTFLYCSLVLTGRHSSSTPTKLKKITIVSDNAGWLFLCECIALQWHSSDS